MICLAYLGSAVLTVPLALLFAGHVANQWGFLALLVGTFFLASAGASAAYLTVSEVFPMETRALAIAFFYAVGTGLGGIIGPLLFGAVVASHDRTQVAVVFLIGGGVMALGGIAELFLGVRAEQAALEDIAKPLTAEDVESDDSPARQPKRPGPGGLVPNARLAGLDTSAPVPLDLLDAEVHSIADRLRQRGPLERGALADAVGARHWGPGRFASALRTAVRDGRVTRAGRRRYGPADRDDERRGP